MTVPREHRPGPPHEAARIGVMLAIVDFPILSTAVRAVIDGERDMGVVAEATDRASIAARAAAAGPDVIILELADEASAPASGGVDEIGRVRAAAPGAKLIALDCRRASGQFATALRAGAHGFLTREALADDMVGAVRAVAAGHTYASPAIVTRMVDTYVRQTVATADDPYDLLSDREHRILLLAAMGHTNRDIARSLGLSEQTVHHHRAGLMDKLGLHDRVDLLRYAVRRGLLNPSVL